MEVVIKQEPQEDGWAHMGITDDNHFNYSSDVKQEQTEDGWASAAIKDENSDDVQAYNSDNNTVLSDTVGHSGSHSNNKAGDGILVDCDHDYCGVLLSLTCDDVPCRSRTKKRKRRKESTKLMRRNQRAKTSCVRWPAKFSMEELQALCTQYPEITTVPTDRNEIILALRAARRRQRRQQKLAALTPRELKKYRAAEAAKKRKKREEYMRQLTPKRRKALHKAEAAKRRNRQLSVERLRALCIKNNVDIEIQPENLLKGKRALEAALKRKLRLRKLASLTPQQRHTARILENAERRRKLASQRSRWELATAEERKAMHDAEVVKVCERRKRQLTVERLQALCAKHNFDIEIRPDNLIKGKRALNAALRRQLRLRKLASLTPQERDATRILENAKRRMCRLRGSANRTANIIPSSNLQYQRNLRSLAADRVTAGDVEGQQLLLDGLTVDQLEAVDNDDELREHLDQLCQMFRCQTKEQGELALLCHTCGETWHDRRKFHAHMQLHRRVPNIECPICDRPFVSRSGLQIHMRIHDDGRPHKCQLCAKEFAKCRSLKIHMMMHNDERPYVCDTCGKSFRAVNKLTYHQLLHSGERRFECEECSWRFFSKRELTTHMKVHVEARPYVCQGCGRGFFTARWLLTHLTSNPDCR